MNKSKTIQKIELIVMILMLVCAVTMLSIHAVQTAQKDAEKFTWQEIKGTMNEVKVYSEDEIIPLSMPQLDEWVRQKAVNPSNTNNSYGVIAVVKVKKSRNILATFETDSKIRPTEIRSQTPEYSHLSDVLYASKIMTDAEILEVLYQPPGKFYHRGQIVQLREEYFIIDQRVPNILRAVWRGSVWDGTAGPEPEDAYIVRLKDYHPLEEGEIYLVYTSIIPPRYTNPDYRETWATTMPHVMICLSSPGLKAGNSFYSDSDEAFQWVTEKYNLSKYMK